MELDQVSSPYPNVLYSGQDVIETTLNERLEAAGGRIERGCEVIDVDSDDTGVTVTFKRGEGPPERLRCRYLVAADGAKSTVRSRIGLDFEPERFEGRMNRQADAKLSWRMCTS